MHAIKKTPQEADKENENYYEYSKSKTDTTDEYTVLTKEVEEKHTTNDLSDITRDLRSMFNVDQRNARAWKDANKRHVKEEILAVTRPYKRSECCKTDDGIEVLPKYTLNISFSSEGPRMSGWNPRDPLLITGCICEIQINSVYIYNGSGTDIL